jgi:hypothetical protein
LIDFFGVRAGILGKISAKISPWIKFSTAFEFSILIPSLSPELKELSTAYTQVYQQPNKNKQMARRLINFSEHYIQLNRTTFLQMCAMLRQVS